MSLHSSHYLHWVYPSVGSDGVYMCHMDIYVSVNSAIQFISRTHDTTWIYTSVLVVYLNLFHVYITLVMRDTSNSTLGIVITVGLGDAETPQTTAETIGGKL